MTREDIAERLAGPWARTGLTGEGQSLTLGAEIRHTGDVVLFWHNREHGGGEVGYVLHRIIARIYERNEPSVRLARRVGMR